MSPAVLKERASNAGRFSRWRAASEPSRLSWLREAGLADRVERRVMDLAEAGTEVEMS